MDTVQERIEGHPFPFIYMTRPCSTCTRRLPCLFTNLLRNMPLYRLERKSTLPWRYQFGEGRRHGSIEERKKTANKFNRPKRALRKHGGDED